MTTEYDAIVVGASFAGLAVARRLRGRVLLLDRHEIGEVEAPAMMRVTGMRGRQVAGARHCFSRVRGAWRTAAASLFLLALAYGPAAGEAHIQSLIGALGLDVPARPLAAPPFTAPDLNGASVRLADHAGRVVMLYFWTTW